MQNKINSFKDLLVWEKSHRCALDIYKATKNFPKEELFSLTNQMRRSAVSIGSNIAEGFGRNSAKDKGQFYAIAKGSAFELESQLYIAKDLGYISEGEARELEEKLTEVGRMLSGLIKSASDRIK